MLSYSDAFVRGISAGFGADDSFGSLRFYGTGSNDVDRVKVTVDGDTEANVGATDFTIEFFIRTTSGNNAGAITAGANYNWINGNIIIDRDRYNQGRAFGISLGAGRVVFGVKNNSDTVETWVGSTDVRDGQWHHIAVTRNVTTGAVQIYVDGTREVNDTAGPTGTLAYPNGATPGNFCNPGGNSPCTYSDPYMVIGAEKHDAGSSYPSFFGYFTELRLSTVLRYSGATLTVPSAPFTDDVDTAGLYHFEEGNGTSVADASGNGNPGTLYVGGASNGPTWESSSPF